jgi:hypothetical protein
VKLVRCEAEDPSTACGTALQGWGMTAADSTVHFKINHPKILKEELSG